MEGEELIARYFVAMRRGADAEEDLMALFAADAVYTEPFTSEAPAVGIDEIRARFREGWKSPLPAMELDVLSIEVDGPRAQSRWECRSPVLPSPVRGEDHYELRDGLITRLDVRIDSGEPDPD